MQKKNLKQFVGNVLKNFGSFFLPDIDNVLGDLFGGNGKSHIKRGNVTVLDDESRLILTRIEIQSVIALNRKFIPEFECLVGKIILDVILDEIGKT